MKPRFSSILIYGLGLMGGSLARDLQRLRREHGFDLRIDGAVRSARSGAIAQETKLVDGVFVGADIAALPLDDYDLVVLGLPVAGCIELLPRIPAGARAVFTDVGSTKRGLMDAYNRNGFIERFALVGSHPMAGTEHSGPGAAIENLYKGKLVFIFDPAPPLNAAPETAARLAGAGAMVEELWRLVGANTWKLGPAEHDEALAYLSHTPHILAGLIAGWAARNPTVNRLTSGGPMPLTGGGFKDMVRIAGSNPEMWTEILFTNRDMVLQSLRDFERDLGGVIRMVSQGSPEEWRGFFAGALRNKKFLTGL